MPDTPGPRNPFDDPDLRRRVFYTLGALAAFRVGTFVPLPGADRSALKAFVEAGPLRLLDSLAGGALGRFSLLSLGVAPYVVAAIVAGLLKGGRKRRETGEAARRLTPLLALLQALALVRVLADAGVFIHPTPLFYALMALTLAAGALFTMWLCEEIAESGIGGGALLIVFAGLVAGLPGWFGRLFSLVRGEDLGLFAALAVLAALLLAAAAAVLIETAQQKLTVHYTQRVVGRRMYGGSQSVLPLKLDSRGVVAAIMATAVVASLAALPLSGGSPLPGRGGWIDDVLYAALILFFGSFSGASPVDPDELADNLKKAGGAIPGIRSGEATARYIQRVHERLALDGAFLVAALAVLPDVARRLFRLPFFFGGIPLLVVVGVALDAMGRVESHSLRRAYAKFLK